MYALLADLTAVVHLGLVGLLVVGGPWACVRRSVLGPHLAVLVGIGAFNLTGSDCPLTTLEQHLRRLDGQPAYGGGFISHYLVEPWYPAGITPAVDVAIYAVALVPSAAAYAWIAFHLRRPTLDAATAGTAVR